MDVSVILDSVSRARFTMSYISRSLIIISDISRLFADNTEISLGYVYIYTVYVACSTRVNTGVMDQERFENNSLYSLFEK